MNGLLMRANLLIERGLRSKRGSGLGITCPVALETLTLVPSSKNRLVVFVGLLLFVERT